MPSTTPSEPLWPPDSEIGPVEEDVINRFTYHPPTSDQLPRYGYLRAAFRDLALGLVHNCPESRERSLALTNLEIAAMFANASIARETV